MNAFRPSRALIGSTCDQEATGEWARKGARSDVLVAVVLTKREMEVLILHCEGDCTKKVIAEILGISEETVKSYSKTLRHKMGARNMRHAVSIGYQTGLLH